MNSATRSRLCVYLVTDQAATRGRSLLAVIGAALQGGVRAVQLRDRAIATRELLSLAKDLRALTRRHDALLLVNDRIDVALACDADGVHLPSHSFRVADARALLGPARLIGVSTHRVEEVVDAKAGGADFVVFGPVYATPSKEQYGDPLGTSALEQATRVGIPVLAIGGITPERAPEIRARNASGIAVIRAVLSADDPAAAAAQLLIGMSNRP